MDSRLGAKHEPEAMAASTLFAGLRGRSITKTLEKMMTALRKPAIAGRLLADVVGIFCAVTFAHTLGYLYIVFRQPEVDLRGLLDSMIVSYTVSLLLLFPFTVVVFSAMGIYTQGRLYAGRYKIFTLFHAVSLSFLMYLAGVYFLRDIRLSRVVVLLSYLFTLLALSGSRLLKSYLTRSYKISFSPVRSALPERRVLVIGGAGYIGSVLVRQLLQTGCSVRVLDSFLYGTESLAGWRANGDLEIVRGDFRHVETVSNAVNGVQDVIHLGGLVGDPACSLDGNLTLQINLAATKMIRDICVGNNIQRFIFASTCSVYGATEAVCSEESAENPVSLYACTKLDSEKILLPYPEGSSFRPTILRLATVFGPSLRPRLDLVVNLLAARAWFERKITIFNPDQWRPFVHVEDVAAAMVSVLRAPTECVAGEIFNLGEDSLNCRIGDLGRLIGEIIPGIQIEELGREADPRSYKVNFEKIHKVVGFRCQYDLATGIRQLCAMFEAGLIVDWQDERFSNEQTLKRLNLQPLEDDVPMAWTRVYLSHQAHQPSVNV